MKLACFGCYKVVHCEWWLHWWMNKTKGPLLVLSFDRNKMIKLKLFNWWPVFLFVAHNRIKEKKSTHLDKGKALFLIFLSYYMYFIVFGVFLFTTKIAQTNNKNMFRLQFSTSCCFTVDTTALTFDIPWILNGKQKFSTKRCSNETQTKQYSYKIWLFVNGHIGDTLIASQSM